VNDFHNSFSQKKIANRMPKTEHSLLIHSESRDSLFIEFIMSIIFQCLLFVFIIGLQCTLQSNRAEAETTQQEIEKAIQSFIKASTQQQTYSSEQKTTVDIGQINNQASLTDCQKKIQVSSMQQKSLSGRISLKVGCSLPQWSFYVPVHIHLYDTVFFSKQPLIKGELITNNMIQSQSIETTNLSSGYFSQSQQLIGLLMQQTIPGGKIITPNMIKTKPMVRQQEEVTIIVSMEGMNIKTTGIALASGGLGDRIPVKNKSSQRRLEAEIVGDGLVRVNQ